MHMYGTSTCRLTCIASIWHYIVAIECHRSSLTLLFQGHLGSGHQLQKEEGKWVRYMERSKSSKPASTMVPYLNIRTFAADFSARKLFLLYEHDNSRKFIQRLSIQESKMATENLKIYTLLKGQYDTFRVRACLAARTYTTYMVEIHFKINTISRQGSHIYC